MIIISNSGGCGCGGGCGCSGGCDCGCGCGCGGGDKREKDISN